MNQIRKGWAKQAVLSALVLVIPETKAFGDPFRSMASDFAGAGRNAAVRRIAVLPFSSKDGAGPEAGEYVAEKLGTKLIQTGKVEVVERYLLDQVMQEHRLMLTGAIRQDQAKAVGQVLSVDAVVSGSVYDMGDDLGIEARMIDVNTGKVLAATDARIEKPFVRSAMVPQIEVPVPVLDVPAPDLLRDALSDDPQGFDCGDAQRTVEKLQSAFLDLEARFWARKLQDPNFSATRLTHNPGSEISDSELRGRFYDLLKAWYAQEGVPALSPMEVDALAHAENKIKQIGMICGGAEE